MRVEVLYYTMTDSNCSEAYAIEEGDTVEVTTTEENSFTLTCTGVNRTNNTDPDIVEEQFVWKFEDEKGRKYSLLKIEGLRRFEHQEEYPYESQLSTGDFDEGVGFIEEVMFV